jgi:hypothetical protein
LRAALARFEPGCLDGPDAARLVELLAEGEHMCAAGKARVARRVEETNAWRREGHRSVAHWMAVHTGESVGQAVTTLETARRLEELPATQEAFCAGRLSETQTREIASAASALPEAERDLLQVAATETVTGLRERCRRVRAVANEDETDGYEKIRRRRYFKHWTDRDGAFRLDGLLTPDDGARLLAALDVRRQRIFREARAAGRKEPLEAYAADALVDLATGDPGGPAAAVQLRVDHDAWIRGHTIEGEVCEIPGIGPIPVTVARRLGGDAILKAVVTDGTDVTGVAHLGRTIPARVRTALQERDPTCVVPRCDVRHGLEIHHWAVPYAEDQRARLENLARLCRFHHMQATHHGAELAGGPGHWVWTPPPGKPPSKGQLPLPP